MIHNQSRADIRPLMLDITDVGSTIRSVPSFGPADTLGTSLQVPRLLSTASTDISTSHRLRFRAQYRTT